MNRHNNQAIFELISEYENLSERGLVRFFDEKSYFQLIEFYEKDEQLDQALEVVEHALKHHSYSVDFYIKKAQLLLSAHQEEEALVVIELASTFAPLQSDILLLKAQVFAYQEQYDKALALVDQVKDSAYGRELSNAYVAEALVYECQEQYERMFYALKAALKLNPAHKEALERLWLCVELSRKYKDSIQLHEEILEADAYSYMAWYNLGHAHAYMGNYDEAIEAYEFAFVINEEFEYAYRDCAELCFELKMFQKALKCYQEILDNFDADSELLLRIGQCYQHLGHYDTARSYFTRAIYLDSLNDEVYFHIGECYSSEKDWSSAVNYYKKAINIEDKQEQYFAALANAYYRCGKFDKAAPNFQRATQIAPEENQYWVQYAGFLLDMNDGETALSVLDEAEDYAAGAELLYCRIACLFCTGRRQEAYYRLSEALDEEFDTHRTLFQLVPELEQDPAVISLISTYMA